MEIWKDVKGFEGAYMVSDHGRVKSLDRVVQKRNGTHKQIKGKMLKQVHTRCDYLSVCLYKDGIGLNFRINRLVAINFIDNPNGYCQVGHNDDDKENNHVSNLYWTHASENCTHNGRHIAIGQKIGKPIVGIKDNKTLRYGSSLDASRNGFNASAIRNCLAGRSATHQGYEWKYA